MRCSRCAARCQYQSLLLPAGMRAVLCESTRNFWFLCFLSRPVLCVHNTVLELNLI